MIYGFNLRYQTPEYTAQMHQIRDQLGGIIEADEMFIGGKTKKGKKRKTHGASQAHYKSVLGFVQRHGKVITKVIEAPFLEIIMPMNSILFIDNEVVQLID